MATKTAPKTRASKRKTPAKATTASKTRKKPTTRKRKKPQFTSRGVTRPVEAGSAVECAFCGERVKFRAKVRQYQVICNVYEKNSGIESSTTTTSATSRPIPRTALPRSRASAPEAAPSRCPPRVLPRLVP